MVISVFNQVAEPKEFPALCFIPKCITNPEFGKILKILVFTRTSEVAAVLVFLYIYEEYQPRHVK